MTPSSGGESRANPISSLKPSPGPLEFFGALRSGCLLHVLMTVVGSVHIPIVMLGMLIKVLCSDSIATRRRLPREVYVGSTGRRPPLPQPIPLATDVVEHSLGAAEVRSDPDRSRGPSSRMPHRTNSSWISAESARALFRRRKSADASITAFIPLSVRVNGAGGSTGCCGGAGLRSEAGLRSGAFGRGDEGIETEASRRSRSRHTSSYSWNAGCSCSSFRNSSRRS
jgi:hypothetical protein